MHMSDTITIRLRLQPALPVIEDLDVDPMFGGGSKRGSEVNKAA
jgi:hypothetical protein